MESLETEASISDFAILLLTADDKATSRRRDYAAPRDNVVFELGLFMGAISRKRTLIVVEDNKRIKFPSDLKGITCARFSRKNLRRSLGEVYRTIRERVIREGLK
jgi:CRP/FNR family transcriptional regulator, cyclic AMP receptor protein